jgi:phospholipase D1/2
LVFSPIFAILLNVLACQGDGDSEIALVVEDEDTIQTTMNEQPHTAARFAATLRRKLFKGNASLIISQSVPQRHGILEHLGLLPPQVCHSGDDEVTSFMKPAPFPNEDETATAEDRAVADPLADETLNLWYDTARKNREIFTEIFRPVPTNLVRDWSAYDVRFAIFLVWRSLQPLT